MFSKTSNSHRSLRKVHSPHPIAASQPSESVLGRSGEQPSLMYPMSPLQRLVRHIPFPKSWEPHCTCTTFLHTEHIGTCPRPATQPTKPFHACDDLGQGHFSGPAHWSLSVQRTPFLFWPSGHTGLLAYVEPPPVLTACAPFCSTILSQAAKPSCLCSSRRLEHPLDVEE